MTYCVTSACFVFIIDDFICFVFIIDDCIVHGMSPKLTVMNAMLTGKCIKGLYTSLQTFLQIKLL